MDNAIPPEEVPVGGTVPPEGVTMDSAVSADNVSPDNTAPPDNVSLESTAPAGGSRTAPFLLTMYLRIVPLLPRG